MALFGGLLCLPLATAPAEAAPGDVTAYTSGAVQLPSGLSVGPDGNMWFTNVFGNSIGRVTPTGTISTFTDPAGLISSPIDTQLNTADSRVWFTSQGNDRIGNIVATTAFGGTIGTVHTYTSAAIDGPTNLTLGADDSIWFAHAGGIGRITPGATITNFTDATIPHGTSDLKLGPDGNVWFTSFEDNRVGRITPAGAIATFALPATMAAPNGIATGSDGNLWVVGADQGRLAKVSTAGVVTVLPAFTGEAPGGLITSASDGNLWFITDHNNLARITTAGVVSVFPANGHISIGSGLAGGVGGNIWFAGGFTNKVGFIEPGGSPPPPPVRRPDAMVGSSVTGPWKVDGPVAGGYATVVTPAQTQSGAIVRRGNRTIFLRIQNDGTAVDSFRVRAVESDSPKVTITYLRGAQNVSTAVRNGTYTVNDVAPGGSVVIKITFHARADAQAGRKVDLTVRSVNQTTVLDVVRARATLV